MSMDKDFGQAEYVKVLSSSLVILYHETFFCLSGVVGYYIVGILPYSVNDQLRPLKLKFTRGIGRCFHHINSPFAFGEFYL